MRGRPRRRFEKVRSTYDFRIPRDLCHWKNIPSSFTLDSILYLNYLENEMCAQVGYYLGISDGSEPRPGPGSGSNFREGPRLDPGSGSTF